MKRKVVIICLVAAMTGCHKDVPVVLDTTLSTCPTNHTCSYNYFDGADFNGNQLVHGGFRVFSYTSVDSSFCGSTSRFNVKVSLSGNSFDVTSGQIVAGQAVSAADLICPCCYYAFVTRPVDGEIKGRRVNSNTWLINARIIFGPSAGHPTDSMKVNQYFTLAKLP